MSYKKTNSNSFELEVMKMKEHYENIIIDQKDKHTIIEKELNEKLKLNNDLFNDNLRLYDMIKDKESQISNLNDKLNLIYDEYENEKRMRIELLNKQEWNIKEKEGLYDDINDYNKEITYINQKISNEINSNKDLKVKADQLNLENLNLKKEISYISYSNNQLNTSLLEYKSKEQDYIRKINSIESKLEELLRLIDDKERRIQIEIRRNEINEESIMKNSYIINDQLKREEKLFEDNSNLKSIFEKETKKANALIVENERMKELIKVLSINNNLLSKELEKMIDRRVLIK